MGKIAKFQVHYIQCFTQISTTVLHTYNFIKRVNTISHFLARVM